MAAKNGTVTSLTRRRAESLLRDMSSAPFVAMVFTNGSTKIYACGLDDDKLAQLQSFVEELTEQ